uniref:Glycosyl transferase family 2 n=1 Tax=Candidatus Kentrum sp. LFY TaxID=2126342 RepID=A0A450WQ78_9GAMM|nr:MAG: Glycosyl transferase family 2 [Candidatus Kentron sp. LFY]
MCGNIYNSRYLRKHRLFPLRIDAKARPDLGLVVVIPCYDEPDLDSVLDSLWRCARPSCSVEVIVVINAARADTSRVHAQNQRTLALAQRWIAAHGDERLRFHVLYFPELPHRHAGVGLARRIGMDEAVARFAAVGNPEGVIACLDADCRCDPNYLTALVAHFRAHPKSPGCSIYFEHPLDLGSPQSQADLEAFQSGNPFPGKRQASPPAHCAASMPKASTAIRAAIAGYELHLRYYVHGLRYAGSPYAFHTVGSCMAVRTRVYEQQGGMNRRKAGEDFYFLQKIIGLGNFTELRGTRVLPSPRISERTPFGTGRAVADSLAKEDGARYAYAPEVFRDLGKLLSRVGELYGREKSASRLAIGGHDDGDGYGYSDDYDNDGSDALDFIVAGLPEYVAPFLSAQGFGRRCAEIRRNAASSRSFAKRFHRWFNALLTLKFIHFATDHHYPKVPMEQAARVLLAWCAERDGTWDNPRGNHSNEDTPEGGLLQQREALLLQYRIIDGGENRVFTRGSPTHCAIVR